MKNIVIGTAGHIDHGKTTLIKALTGRETDTLAEEKKRGISINLGFTYFDLPNGKRAGIVDVPGHEKFIKNMLAGASSVDIVLLVIAADEGVMPQTIEHLDILSYLNVKNGVIVLTKCDTVDEEFIELVKEDIQSKIEGTFIENAEIIEIDSVSRRGIDTLIEKIDVMSENIEGKDEHSPSRLNIDRVFSVKGFGTVVTGTLLEGKISVDDDLVVYPNDLKTKIRSIQVHGESVDTAYAGQRTAINISNIKVDELKRGDVLALQNSLDESMMVDVKVSLVNHLNKELKHWDRLRLYHGTREILCRAVPIDKDIVKPGESAYVQLRLEESIVAKKGDPFVLRSYSPLETIGGGVIIDISNKKHKRFDKNVIETFKIKEKGELKDIIREYLNKNSSIYPTIKEILVYTGANENIVRLELDKLIEENIVIKINSMYIHINQYNELKEKAIDNLTKYHKKNRLRKGMMKEEFKSRVESKFKNKDIDILIEKLFEEKIIKVENNMVSLYDFYPKLNDKQTEIKNNIEIKLKNYGINNIPSMSDVCENSYYEEVLEYMIGESIERLDDTYIMDKQMYETHKKDLIEYLNDNNEITLAQYRDMVGSTRKNCLIMLDNFDRNKVTRRLEDKRVLFNK